MWSGSGFCTRAVSIYINDFAPFCSESHAILYADDTTFIIIHYYYLLLLECLVLYVHSILIIQLSLTAAVSNIIYIGY